MFINSTLEMVFELGEDRYLVSEMTFGSFLRVRDVLVMVFAFRSRLTISQESDPQN